MAAPIVTIQITKDGDTESENVTIANGGSWTHIEDTVAGTTTDREITCGIDFSQLKAIYINSNVDITLEANSGSAADYTLTISASKPLLWYLGCGLANPITADTTKFFATNAGSDAATLNICIEADPTP